MRRGAWAVTAAVSCGGLIGAIGVIQARPATVRPEAGAASRPARAAATSVAPTTTSSTLPAPVPTAPPAVPPSPLTARLDAVLANTNSCLLVTDSAGTAQYRHQSDVPFAPASTQKLFVAAAALDRLGPAYRFTTTVVARRAPVNGQVDELWLVGSGDPVLSTAEFTAHLALDPLTAGGYPTTPIDTLAAQLAAAGVRHVSNGVHGDDSRYERLRFIPSWPAAYQKEADIAPLGALEVDHGLDRWSPAVLTADPAAHGAGVLARLLGTHGVLAAQGADGVAPLGSVVLARVQSPPLADIVAAMLRSSDNLTAELLVREMDRQAGGNGTTAGGLRLVLADVGRLGVPTGGLHLVDGSGLDAGDRATCSALLAALGLGDRSRFSALRTGLAVAGQNGTLVNRFLGTPVAGHLVAKTGSIDGVNAIVGRLDGTLNGRALRFALVANGSFGYRVGVGLEDRVVAALAAP